MAKNRIPLEQRLLNQILFEPDDGCWLWMGSTSRGYGQINIQHEDGRWIPRRVHRVMFELKVGLIPEGHQLDHLCEVTRCCRPDHLEPVTPLEHGQRGVNAQKAYCIRGHPLSGDNIYTYKRRGGRRRICKTCLRTYKKRRQGP